MRSLYFFLSIVLLTSGCTREESTQPLKESLDPSLQLTYISMQIRDEQPSPSEIKDFLSGKKNKDQLIQEWIASPEHKDRVKRFFWQWFGGVQPVLILHDREYFLSQTPEGNLYIPHRGACAPQDASQVAAWWTDSTVDMCNNSISTLSHHQGNFCGKENNLRQFAECGCGPDQIFCLDGAQVFFLFEEIRNQFSERGWDAYQRGKSWFGLLGDSQNYFGTRWVYWVQLLKSFILPQENLPPQIDLNRLKSLPVNQPGEAPYPSIADFSSVPTSLGFNFQNNNYRSRVAALTSELLCQEVNSSLPAISQYVNPSLSPINASHGARPECASCHNYIENLVLLNDRDTLSLLHNDAHSQIFYLFGVQSSGKNEMIRAFIHSSPDDVFFDCMAKKVWEDFSGEKWGVVPLSEQQNYVSSARHGPKLLIETVLKSDTFKNRADR